MSARCGLLAAMLGIVLAPAVAAAQDRGSDTVYRCGADGRQYSDNACPDGKPVPAADARSAEQRRHAEEVVRRERELADRLTKEREQRERHAPGAVGIGSTGTKAISSRTSTGPKKSPRRKKQKNTQAVKQRA